jgi:type III secretion protein J
MKRLAPLFFVLLCVGCNDVVLHADLQEKEANEMLALLLDAGVHAAKAKGEEGKWMLTVAQGEFAKAVGELRKHGYPRDRYENIGVLFKKSGLVSSPTEERIRLMHGLSQELSDTISQIDGVLAARVHIALPTANPFGEVKQAASASVFIKHRPNANLATTLPQITKLVASSIEGLKYEDVSTVLSVSDEPGPDAKPAPKPETVTIAGLKMAPESVNTFWGIVAAVGGVLLLAIVGLAFALLRTPKPAALKV